MNEWMGFDVAAVSELLGGEEIAWQVEHVAEIGSTNDELIARAKRGDKEGKVLVTDHQSAGRGRQRREWFDRPGEDLLFSVLLRPRLSVEAHGLLSLLTAVALVEALKQLGGAGFETKWPNDVLFAGRKVGGVLVEADIVAGYAVVGVGVNLLGRPEAFPRDLRQIATTAYAATGKEIGREEALAAILSRMGMWYRALREDGPRAMVAAYRQMDTLAGKEVKVQAGNARVSGIAEGIDDSGRLVVLSADGLVVVDSGEVHLLE
jgi:BirA family transcriptional regulator, biotin operon repressor / biotin---[acetyl-CoA-carboxylase] ligase